MILEAAAGLGKTALLERGAALAEDAGCLVRRAAPGPLERHFPFGVIRALLEAPLRDAPRPERARLLDGAAAAAGRLLLEGTAPRGDAIVLVAHSVLWLCSALAEQRPLALVIDDAQWADRASLEVLAYLARRLEDFPLLLLVGARTGDPEAEADLLTLLGSARAATVLRPRPLTAGGALELIRRFAPAAPAAVCLDAAARSTGTRGCWASSDVSSLRRAPWRRRPRPRGPSCGAAWPRWRRAIGAWPRPSRSSATTLRPTCSRPRPGCRWASSARPRTR